MRCPEGKKIWKIKEITEADYGCEERPEGEALKSLVILENSAGERKTAEVKDEWLRQNHLCEGSIWRSGMAGYLIKDTTREEREEIVAESLGNIEANCDGCMSGIVEMYQDYIDGKKELKEINMTFHAGYEKGGDVPSRDECPFQ